MIEVRETDAYSAWFNSLRDPQTRARILVRIRRLSLGLDGDVKPVGEGVSELRIHYGPGYRVYFVNRGGRVIILLGGGDKGSQAADIKAAKALLKEI
ncbi:type II toxin-antitoxin system RelE/ParE family toxin [Sinorhizobium fredii]|uniref:type II toxin-antitoxin system RelE/ParE family toxin n=1 Tax=Rhizobium fredii TaxID=380 RepID=UPI0005956151|nr:type II toxin-antitoxin system RelE/ParE family toxin [Sinorhizobium fredii]WOS62176.1 type II toxin-antitoxin system RelE/ParE family toxin [Sinorhizobium fredii GR64]